MNNLIKNVAIWLVIALVLMSVFNHFGTRQVVQSQVDYSQFTGLAESLRHGILAWMPGRTPLAFTMIFTALAILMTEVASNTASATMMVPIAIAVSTAAGVRPLEPALGATIGASMAFMLPISTPPNAIVYSSGCVPITAMIRHGVVLDLFAFAAIVTFVLLFGSIVVG